MNKIPAVYIVRCSDGWMSCSSTYEGAEKKALEHIAGRDITYVII